MQIRLASLALVAIGACASPRTAPVATAPAPAASAPASAPATAPSPAAAPVPTPPPAPALTEAPADWQLLDASADRVPGISARRAEQELLAGRKPARTVVVAVIDGGVDTAHVDLRANLWHNPREVAGNRKDDDGNGYVDDTYGWNFLGGANGENVNWDTLELTREQVRCTQQPPMPADPEGRARCEAIAKEFAAKRTEYQQLSQQVQMMDGMYARVTRILGREIPPDSLNAARVTALQPAADSVRAARDLYLRMAASGITGEAISDAKTDLEGRLDYGLNTDFNPRTIVGDDPRNVAERHYGNRDVTGPDAKHGTHVAGIIGAVRGNDAGSIDGIASAVKLMVVRAVPNGDEHDKDVANAIRYAVDNGAQVINMSFGKDFSPDKGAVDEAVKYADSRGVLLVHAAGNDSKDLATEASYPTPEYAGGGRAANWIEVGAAAWQGGEKLAAGFTNYGKAQVDVFAPGVDILSTIPGGRYARESGTSMAAPVVSGLAALLMSYFPKLTAADVKRIILESATDYSGTMVVRPGSQSGEKVRFGDLSRTGGVVNAYTAVKAAMAASGMVQ
ncbi:MAG: peptidase S8 [Gemmatimonadota bacterium]